ncbi:hypothetical protein JK628_02335 [Shewanella sp. KX20019]|uniref:Ig-like domain-containing protein n=1 Tax=Shewanella sp. KX20019 TaxID=2803864 RepID=UPI001926A674|nr:hypothetical protein [Shewanella sp. KX20019]QQX80732.1 hypothetical protein JK628_02335 [Shewanella sp. KX20019]
MNNTRGLLSAVILSAVLSACGGGDDSSSSKPDDGNNGGSVSNNAPTLLLGQSSISLEEGLTTDISINAQDSDGDKLTYSVTSSNAAVSGSVSSDTLTIRANEVESDFTTAITLTVSDGKASTSKTVTVEVKDKPNNIPTLALEKSEISLSGNSTIEVGITATDLDGDELSYAFSSTSPVISAAISGEYLVITAGDVAAGSTVTLTITVSDGKDSIAKNITVSVSKYVAYSVSWFDAEAINLSVAQAAKARFPFEIELGSVEQENITYRVVMNVDSGLNQAAISAVVNPDSKEVIVSPSSDNQGDYTGVLTVSDGVTTETLNFSLNVYYANRSPFLDSENFVFLEEGVTKTFDMASSEVLDADSLVIYEAEPFDVFQGDASKISFTYDNSAKTYSLTALAGSKFSVFFVRINTTDSFGGIAGSAYEVYVKGATTSQERELEEKIVLAQKFVKQSQELERLSDFLIDGLEMQSVLTQQEALNERLLIADSRYFSENDSTEELNCMLGAVQNGFAVNYTFKGGYIDGDYVIQLGYICNVGEEETYDRQTGKADSQFYANATNYALAVSNIERIRGNQEDSYYSAGGQNIIERTNRLSGMLQTAVPSFELGRVYWEQMNELDNGFYSRFVGNTTYGAYQGDAWVWKPEYEVLSIATSMANEAVLD